MEILNKDIVNEVHVGEALIDGHIEEASESDTTTINTSQGSDQEEDDGTKCDEDEDFVIDC